MKIFMIGSMLAKGSHRRLQGRSNIYVRT